LISQNTSDGNVGVGVHGKNDFGERFKILLDTDLKIIFLNAKIILMEL